MNKARSAESKAQSVEELDMTCWFGGGMLKNYMIVAIRNLMRHWLYTVLHVFGLAVGMACCLLIGLYVYHSFSYDAFHRQADRIYRVYVENEMPQGKTYSASSPNALCETLRMEFSELCDVVRIFNMDYRLSVGQTTFKEQVAFVDVNVFDVFDFPLAQGDPHTAFSDKYGMVVTQTLARKFFGDENPIGKTIRVKGQQDFVVTGVLEPIPAASSLRFDALFSYAALNSFMDEKEISAWWAWGTQTYVRLAKSVTPDQLVGQFPNMIKRHAPAFLQDRFALGLQNLRAIHLDPSKQGDVVAGVSPKYLYALLGVAGFVLLIACFNYVNLSLARYGERLKEMGLRKVLGAERKQLVRQFLGESVMLCGLALLVGLAFVELALPFFAAFTQQALTLGDIPLGWFVVGLVGFCVGLGILAGLYPGLVLSRWQPVAAIKGLALVRHKHAYVRHVLVTLQFAIAVLLIVGGAVVFRQVHFMQTYDVGYDPGRLIVFSTQMDDVGEEGVRSFVSLLGEQVGQAGILSMGTLEDAPGERYHNRFGVMPEGASDDALLEMSVTSIDAHFLKTFDMDMVGGRGFDAVRDGGGRVLVNEAAVAEMGWDDAVGKRFRYRHDKRPLEVIGVIPDVHFQSLHTTIEPVIFRLATQTHHMRYVVARVDGARMSEAIAFLDGLWQETVATAPFDHYVLDDHLAAQYEQETKTAQLIGAFSALAIMLACLGLLGLVSLTVHDRKKEMSVRKVLGATEKDVVVLIAKSFFYLVVLANVIIWPVSYWVMEGWLQQFAYRIDLGVDLFLMGGMITLGLAMVTVGYLALKAARANPVDALRYE